MVGTCIFLMGNSTNSLLKKKLFIYIYSFQRINVQSPTLPSSGKVPPFAGFHFQLFSRGGTVNPLWGEGGEWRVMYSRPKQGGYEEERVVQVTKGRFQKKN